MRHKALDRFNAAAQEFTRTALDCAAELRLIAQGMERFGEVAANVAALDFAPDSVRTFEEARVMGDPAPGELSPAAGDAAVENAVDAVERSMARLFAPGAAKAAEEIPAFIGGEARGRAA